MNCTDPSCGAPCNDCWKKGKGKPVHPSHMPSIVDLLETEVAALRKVAEAAVALVDEIRRDERTDEEQEELCRVAGEVMKHVMFPGPSYDEHACDDGRARRAEDRAFQLEARVAELEAGIAAYIEAEQLDRDDIRDLCKLLGSTPSVGTASPELRELARKAVASCEARKDEDVDAWAAKLAEDACHPDALGNEHDGVMLCSSEACARCHRAPATTTGDCRYCESCYVDEFGEEQGEDVCMHGNEPNHVPCGQCFDSHKPRRRPNEARIPTDAAVVLREDFKPVPEVVVRVRDLISSEAPMCTHPSASQKWFNLRGEFAIRWCSQCGALNRGETWEPPVRRTDYATNRDHENQTLADGYDAGWNKAVEWCAKFLEKANVKPGTADQFAAHLRLFLRTETAKETT